MERTDGQTDGQGATLNAVPYEGPHTKLCYALRCVQWSSLSGQDLTFVQLRSTVTVGLWRSSRQ